MRPIFFSSIEGYHPTCRGVRRIGAGPEGWCWFFGALDHCCADVVGWEVVKRGDRFAALEPIRQGLREHFGGVSHEAGRGLVVRCDHGPQYTADDFWGELSFCGIEVSYAYGGEPECNGIVERFLRTLKEQVLWVHRSLAQARASCLSLEEAA